MSGFAFNVLEKSLACLLTAMGEARVDQSGQYNTRIVSNNLSRCFMLWGIMAPKSVYGGRAIPDENLLDSLGAHPSTVKIIGRARMRAILSSRGALAVHAYIDEKVHIFTLLVPEC